MDGKSLHPRKVDASCACHKAAADLILDALVQIENLVVLAAGLSASAEDACAVLHTGRLEVSNVAPPEIAARSKALQWLLVSTSLPFASF